jgi:hypothetical protein
VPARELIRNATAAGIRPRTVYRAKAKLRTWSEQVTQGELTASFIRRTPWPTRRPCAGPRNRSGASAASPAAGY